MNKKSLTAREIVFCALFTTLIIVGTYIKIPIPVIPFTLQFLFTNLAGLLLGRKLGSISVVVYIILGLIGLPVFTSGSGIGYVLFPTFGYIIGFLIGTYVAGYISEKKSSFLSILIAGLVNLLIVYTLGIIYYYFIANYYINSPIGVWTLILHGFIFVVPGDIIICFISALLYKRLYPFTKGALA